MRYLFFLLVVLAGAALLVGLPGGHGVPADSDTTGSISPAAGAASWIGKPVMSADGVEVGTVVGSTRAQGGRPASVTVDVPGLFGLSDGRVTLDVGPGAFDGRSLRVRHVASDIRDLAAVP